MNEEETNRKIGLIVFFAILGFFLFLMPFTKIWAVVNAGHVGVVTQFGAVNRVVEPGIVFKLPFFLENISHMETRTQKEEVDAQAASKDLQEVKSTVALNFHLRGEKAVDVYQNLGTEYKERIIAPAMQEAFKATTAKFTASELIGKRESVKAIAYKELKARLEKHSIIVDDFNIVNFNFSKEFNEAIEQKTVAEQNKQRAVIEAQTAREQAQGQADAQKLLKDSGSLSQEYLQFLALQKWDGKLPNATSGVPFITIPSR